MCAYGIIGYGIDVDRVAREIDKEKLIAFLKEQGIYEEGRDTAFDYAFDDFDNMAHLFRSAGSGNWVEDLTCDCNDSSSYLYYPAILPWQIRDFERNLKKEDIEDAIISCVSKLTNLTPEQILGYIGYVDDIYWG